MFKNQFVQMVQPAPLHALINAEKAWEHFKVAIKKPLDDSFCEEFGFSMSNASYFDGTKVHTDVNFFQIYFGRLIEAKKIIPGTRQR